MLVTLVVGREAFASDGSVEAGVPNGPGVEEDPTGELDLDCCATVTSPVVVDGLLPDSVDSCEPGNLDCAVETLVVDVSSSEDSRGIDVARTESEGPDACCSTGPLV